MPLKTRPALRARRHVANLRHLLRSPRSSLVPASLLVLGVVLGAVPLAKDLRDSTVRSTERDLRGLTALLAEQADRTLMAVSAVEDALGDDLASRPRRAEGDFAAWAAATAVRGRLDASASKLPQVVGMAIVDRRGKVLAASHGWPVSDADVSGRPFFRNLTATDAPRATATAPTRGRDGVTMTLFVSHRLSGVDDGTLGYVLGSVDMRFFERLYADVSPIEADVISMVAEDRTMLARHPSPPGAIGRIVPPIPGLRRSPGDPEGSGVARMTTPIDGRDRFIAIRPLDHYPLIVGASRTVDAALAAWHKQTTALAVTIALLLAAFLLLLRTEARRLRDRALLGRSEAARQSAEARAESDRRLKEDYARFGQALDGMGQGLCVLDAAERVVFANTRMATLFDLPAEFRHAEATLDDLLTRVRAVVPARQASSFVTDLRAAATERQPATLTCVLADDRILGVSVEPVADGGLVCTFEDQTERRRSEALIAHMAHHDALTGLPNRLMLSEAIRRLSTSPERSRRGALLLLDLDGFKQINDVHGHLLGDALLKSVAERLRGALDDDRDLLGRLGGDEFAVVCDLGAPASAEQEPERAIVLANRIVAALREPFTFGGTHVSIGTSIGIALPDGVDQSSECLLRDADVALYRAKAMGRGTWCLFEAPPERHPEAGLEVYPALMEEAA